MTHVCDTYSPGYIAMGGRRTSANICVKHEAAVKFSVLTVSEVGLELSSSLESTFPIYGITGCAIPVIWSSLRCANRLITDEEHG